MERNSHRRGVIALIAGTAMAIWPLLAGAQDYSTTSPKPTIGESISSTFKQGADAVTPKPVVKPADDPVSLRSKAKPGSQLYVAMAQYLEQAGKPAEAEVQYKKALQDSPDDLRALLSYARMKDRTGDPQEALKLYQRAAKAHPKEPSVFNNMAVYYARRSMLREAIAAMQRAIQLKPKDVKYRNNLATILIETGNRQEAFKQLRAVHDEAAAYYNMGYLLHKKGERQAAAQHFAIALRLNPSMVEARQWLDRIATAPAAPPSSYPAQQPRMAANPGYYRPGYRPAAERPSYSGYGPSAVRQLPPPPSDQRNESSELRISTPGAERSTLQPVAPRPSSASSGPELTSPSGSGTRSAPDTSGSDPVAPLPPDSRSSRSW